MNRSTVWIGELANVDDATSLARSIERTREHGRSRQ
jgi:hypothetical protein